VWPLQQLGSECTLRTHLVVHFVGEAGAVQRHAIPEQLSCPAWGELEEVYLGVPARVDVRHERADRRLGQPESREIELPDGAWINRGVKEREMCGQ